MSVINRTLSDGVETVGPQCWNWHGPFMSINYLIFILKIDGQFLNHRSEKIGHINLQLNK